MEVNMCIGCKKLSTGPCDFLLHKRFYSLDMLPKAIHTAMERHKTDYEDFNLFTAPGLYVIYTFCVECGIPPIKDLRSVILIENVRAT